MSIGKVIANIGLGLVILTFLVAAIFIGYSEINMEYKYTANVSCYDKHDNKIDGMTCSMDIYCGPFQKQVTHRDEFISCEDDVRGKVGE